MGAQGERFQAVGQAIAEIKVHGVDGQFTGDPYIAKLLETKAKLVGGERASAVIAISADYANDASDAEKALRAFSSALRGLAAKLREASRP